MAEVEDLPNLVSFETGEDLLPETVSSNFEVTETNEPTTAEAEEAATEPEEDIGTETLGEDRENDAVSQDTQNSSQKECFSYSLPLARVKKILKLDPDTHLVTSDTVKCIAMATEKFLGQLAKAAYTQAVLDKRKTVQRKDIDKAISSSYTFEFLEDTLDGWPETSGKSALKTTAQEIPEGEDAMEEDVETGQLRTMTEDSPAEEAQGSQTQQLQEEALASVVLNELPAT